MLVIGVAAFCSYFAMGLLALSFLAPAHMIDRVLNYVAAKPELNLGNFILNAGALLIIVWPLSLYLMWKYRNWTPK